MADLMYIERVALTNILLDSFPSVVTFQRLSDSLGRRPDDFAPGEGITIRLTTLISDFDGRGEILQFLESVPKTPGWEADDQLKVALSEFKKKWMNSRRISQAILNNPYQAWRVDQGRLFIDRKPLRDHVKELAEKDRRFMVVNGPKGSGKTYSIYYLNFLRSLHKFKFKASHIVIERELPTTYYPDVFARRIARDLGLSSDEIPQQQNVKDRWAGEVCDWLVDQLLRAESNQYWIVLDGFNHPDLPKETKQMVAALIDAVDLRLTNVRLVLIDYPEALRSEIRPLVRDETLHHFDREELTIFFQERFEQPRSESDEELIAQYVDKIMTDLPSDPKERMATITDRVSEILEEFGLEEEPA
jgi:hypothetical protein